MDGSVPGESPETLGISMPQGGHPPHHSITSSARRRISLSIHHDIGTKNLFLHGFLSAARARVNG
jgi:hypothetical protein